MVPVCVKYIIENQIPVIIIRLLTSLPRRITERLITYHGTSCSSSDHQLYFTDLDQKYQCSIYYVVVISSVTHETSCPLISCNDGRANKNKMPTRIEVWTKDLGYFKDQSFYSQLPVEKLANTPHKNHFQKSILSG